MHQVRRVAIVKPGRELATLTEWTLLETFPIIRRSAPCNRAAWYFADLIGRFLHQPEPHPASWDALVAALRGLGENRPVENAILGFQWAILCDLGYRPRLDLDSIEGDPVAFSPASGGIVSDTGTADRWRVRRATVDALKALESGASPNELVDPDVVTRATRLLGAWIRELLGQESVPMKLLFES